LCHLDEIGKLNNFLKALNDEKRQTKTERGHSPEVTTKKKRKKPKAEREDSQSNPRSQ